MSTRPLKILCLHGYRQTGEGFRTKSGGFRKLLKKKCEYVFISAPHEIPDTDERGWWFSEANKSYFATEVSQVDDGFEEALDVVAKALENEGPFDGILSFSQGACLGAIITILQAAGDKRFENLKFAILAAGYKSRTEQHQKLYTNNNKVNIPTLHIIGDSDQVINREMSDDLLQYFENENTTVARHDLGHILPTKGDAKAVIVEFINQRHKEINN
jgi:predicted esterase